jgi:hypothetical protein
MKGQERYPLGARIEEIRLGRKRHRVEQTGTLERAGLGKCGQPFDR